ncbi:MAG TPA: hypothetical protein V6C97_24490 [Oculatellaceae cyanobacterium]
MKSRSRDPSPLSRVQVAGVSVKPQSVSSQFPIFQNAPAGLPPRVPSGLFPPMGDPMEHAARLAAGRLRRRSLDDLKALGNVNVQNTPNAPPVAPQEALRAPQPTIWARRRSVRCSRSTLQCRLFVL